MPITHEFEYFKPQTLEEAADLVAEYGGNAKILAGGTDLVVRLKEGLDKPRAVIDIKAIPGMTRLEISGGNLIVGAGVTFTQLIESETVRKTFPVLWEAARTVASPGVRNRATMAGNLCSAVPSLDSGPALLVYGAKIMVSGKKDERTIPVEEWFVAPRKTALCDEIVTAILIPLPEKKAGGCYIKLKRYEGEDLAQAGVSVLALQGNSYRVAIGAVCPVPKRVRAVEELLEGKKLSDELLKKVCVALAKEVCAITDIRATVEYRNHMTAIMLERGLKAAVARLAGKGPAYGENLI